MPYTGIYEEPAENADTPDNASIEQILARCFFVPLEDGEPGTEAVALGVDDCYIKIDVEESRTVYTVECQYVNRDGSRFYIEGDTRKDAEEYLRKLVDSLGGLTSFSNTTIRGQTVPVPNRSATPGLLYNPFTDSSYAPVYLIQAEHQDSGHRYYGFTLTFAAVNYPFHLYSGASSEDFSIVEITPTPGTAVTVINGPYEVSSAPGSHFTEHRIRGLFIGPFDIAAVADDLLLGRLVQAEIPRGTNGNRGVIKSFELTAEHAFAFNDLPEEEPLGDAARGHDRPFEGASSPSIAGYVSAITAEEISPEIFDVTITVIEAR